MARLIDELKRRNVIRAALAYLAAAWLVAQLVTVLGDLVALPPWLGPLLLVVLAAGFVVVVTLAWMYELTGQGFKTEAAIRADPTLVRVPARYLDFLIIGLLTLALGYFIWESRFERRDIGGPQVLSVAVLPFTDLSPGGDQAWFAAGMAEELMNALVRIPDLRVAGRRSASSFDPDTQDLADFAAAVGVSHVLEGSVRTADDRIRVSAELVRAADGINVWSRVFDEGWTDIFAVQERIAEGVIDGLRLHIGGADRLPRQSRKSADFASYKAYLQGRYHLGRRTARDLELAIDYFHEALRLEPDRSQTHSGLAAVYAFMPYYRQPLMLDEAGALARSHAQAAIELDEDNAEAHAILGVIYMNAERNWDEAAAELARAYELGGGDADIVNVYGDYFYNVGDYASALVMEGAAAALDPLSAVHQLELGLVHAFRGEFDRAIQHAELAISLNENLENAWWQLCRSYIYSGDFAAAARMLEEHAGRLGPGYAGQGRALLAARQGDRSTAMAIAADRERDFLANGGSPTVLAFHFALAGDDRKAADYLERAYTSADAILVSPMYFFLPEDWADLTETRKALNKPGLTELYDLRRRHIAGGTGRGPP
ncbi:MAG: hypothetical protein ACREQZ_00170 [Woeseiaceae bacterium]